MGDKIGLGSELMGDAFMGLIGEYLLHVTGVIGEKWGCGEEQRKLDTGEGGSVTREELSASYKCDNEWLSVTGETLLGDIMELLRE